MDTHQDEIKNWINNAIELEKRDQFQGAEDCYTRAIHILKSVLQTTFLSSDDRQAVMRYTSDVAKRIQKLRAINRQCAMPKMEEKTSGGSGTSRQAPKPFTTSVSTAQPALGHLQQPATGCLRFVSSPVHEHSVANIENAPIAESVNSAPLACSNMPGTKDLPDAVPPLSSPKLATNSTGARTPIPSPPPPPLVNVFSAKPPVDGDSTEHSRDTGTKGDRALPPPSHPPGHFAPRASEFILKAIDVASKLCQQGELKRAVDVLQHAHQAARNERGNPRNFKEIEVVLEQMRQRYYEKFPPRFLQDNPVLPEEMEVLRRSGITTTIRLPCWDDIAEGYGAENIFMPCEGVWKDSFTPQLSQKQREGGAQLVHIANLHPKTSDLAIVKSADPLGVTQTVVGDCSMVCSLIICASYQKRFPKGKIISNVIYPQDGEHNPIVNPKGKYAVKMLINGMTRLVTIDDRLPANPFTKQLLCTYSRDRTELWVSLMEKAFVKVCGGSYEFPGSTSASDLYKLSGWLPDSLKMNTKDFNADLQWKRLLHSFTIGAVLITLMTPDASSQQVERDLKLPSKHAYAVLNLFEAGSERIVQLRNPWSCFTWKGALSLEDKSSLAEGIHKSVGYNKDMADIGVFLMRWDDVIKFFDDASLSWNPYMLYPTPEGMSRKPIRLACHGTYTYTTSMADMPQLHISVVNAPKPTRMHLVFSRHVTDVAEFGSHSSKNKQEPRFVALKVFDLSSHPSVAQFIGGRCVFGMCYCRRVVSVSSFPSILEPLNVPVYYSAVAHTVSFDCSPGTTQLVVVVAARPYASKAPFHFSVTLHTELPQVRLGADVAPASPPSDGARCPGPVGLSQGIYGAGVFMHWIPKTCLKYAASVKGSWVKGSTCGGRSDTATFVYNPQYTLKLQKTALFSVRISASDCEESCGICLARRQRGSSSEKPLTSFDSRIGNLSKDADFVMKAKFYTVGGALIDSALPQTLSHDPHHLVKTAVKPPITLLVEVSSKYSYDTPHSFTIKNVNENDEVGMVFLSAIENGFLLCPLGYDIKACGILVDHSKLIKDILDNDANTQALNVKLTPKIGCSNIQRGTAYANTPLFSMLQNIVRDIIHSDAKMTSYLSQLSNLRAQALASKFSELTSTAESSIETASTFVMDYVKRQSLRRQGNTTDAKCLLPLPAGEYTLIPSLWKKGIPGTFEVVVEATEPVSIQPIPPEGEGLFEKRVSGQLLATGKALSGRIEAPMRLQVKDSYFQNSNVAVSLGSRGVLTCRLLLLPDSPNNEDAKDSADTLIDANVSLFSAHDECEWDMISSSGSYTSLGIAIPPVVLEAKTLYVLVISSAKPSICKYVLRIYTSQPCIIGSKAIDNK